MECVSNVEGKLREEPYLYSISRIRSCHPKRQLWFLLSITAIFFLFIYLKNQYEQTDVSNQEQIWIGGDALKKQKLVIREADEAGIASSLSSGWAEPPTGDTLYKQSSMSTITPLKVQNVTLSPALLSPPIIKAIGTLRSQVKTHFEDRNVDIDFTPGEAIPTSKVRRLLIVSSWRSGSTFLSDMLSSKPWTFYNYEPLILYDRYPDIQPDEIEKFFRLVRDIFTCNFTPHVDYVKYINKYKFLIGKNLVMKKICSSSKEYLCRDPNFHSEVCRYLPYNIVKTVRADLIHFESLLDDPALDLRMIYLIRDPRGVFNSRKKTTWCTTEMCGNVQLACENMLSNLKMAEIYQDKYRGRFLTVRFEDMCLFPEQTTKQILDVADLPYQGDIETFLKAHTSNTVSVKNKYAYGTFRNSADVAFRWRKSFSFENVVEVQEHCHEVLDLLGMTSFKNEVDYRNMSISVMKDT